MKELIVVFSDGYISKGGGLKGYGNNPHHQYSINSTKRLIELLSENLIVSVKTKEGWYYPNDKIVKYGDFSQDEIRDMTLNKLLKDKE